MKKHLLVLLVFAVMPFLAFAQDKNIVTFEFKAGDDMFYGKEIPENQTKLEELTAFLDRNRATINQTGIRTNVDAYSLGEGSVRANKNMSFVLINRVKAELIIRSGLSEDQIHTQNLSGAYGDQKNVVVVTVHLPQVQLVPERPQAVEEKPAPAPQPNPELESVVEKQPEPQPVAVEKIPEPITYSRWSVGVNVGVPFFWGDMNSLAADKTYIGISAGVQGTYQISPLFGITLSLDWAQNKAGSRDYAKGYLLDPAGMTWYTPQTGTTQKYGDLYSKINMYSAGLHLDVNVNHLFGAGIANSRLKLIVSPAVYTNHFSSKVYTKSDDKVYVGESLSKDLSLGLGGDVALRYNVSHTIDLQLKGTGMWITDNLFDNIRTVGYVKQNAMWGISVGAVWKLGHDTNLLHKKK